MGLVRSLRFRTELPNDCMCTVWVIESGQMEVRALGFARGTDRVLHCFTSYEDGFGLWL